MSWRSLVETLDEEKKVDEVCVAGRELELKEVEVLYEIWEEEEWKEVWGLWRVSFED